MLKKLIIIVAIVLILTEGAFGQKIYFTPENGVACFTNEPLSTKSKLVLIESSSKEISHLPYAHEISHLSQKAGLDPKFVTAVVKTESNFNPQAVSRKGAQGLMQLMPSTSKNYNVQNPFNPWDNLKAGIEHLKNLLARYQGDQKLALAAYNAGGDAVKKYGGVPPYPETNNYINQVFNYYKKINTSLKKRDFFQPVNEARLPGVLSKDKILPSRIYRYVNKKGEVVFTNLTKDNLRFWGD